MYNCQLNHLSNVRQNSNHRIELNINNYIYLFHLDHRYSITTTTAVFIKTSSN